MNAIAIATDNDHQLARMPETASSAVAAQAKALVEARYIMAIKRPRDIDEVRERLLKECRRPSFAAVARYNKPVGKGIQGPSIRFAEAAIRCMTNITVETMTVYDDREKRIVRVTVTDLEANLPYSLDVTIEKTIERKKFKDGDIVIRSRINSYGEKVHLLEAGEDDILNKQNALISKAIRTQGLRLVPGDLVDEGQNLCIQTQRSEDAKDPDAAKRALFDAYGQIGVKIEELKAWLGHDGSTLAPKELTDLRGLYAALRDGETTWREIMDERKPKDASATSTAKPAGKGAGDKLRDAVTGGDKPKDPPAGAAAATTGGPGELIDETFEAVETVLNAAKTNDELNNAADRISLLGDPDQRKQLTALYNQRLSEV